MTVLQFPERTRVCDGPCGQEKPWSEFWAKKRNPDGSVSAPRNVCKACKRVRDREMNRARRASAHPVDRERPPRLRIGPWRTWLLAAEPRYGSREEMCRDMGISERQLSRWLTDRFEKTQVSSDTVDRIACRIGEPWLLRDLYPELWESERVAA